MARVLIVGCGCRGRSLGVALGESGWRVRGTTRDPRGMAAIEDAGIEPAIADPSRPGTLLDLIEDVAVVAYLLGSIDGSSEGVASVHADRLEHLLARLVDTPVRGFVYEATGSAPDDVLRGGAVAVAAAEARWRLPAEILERDPTDHELWLGDAAEAVRGVASGRLP